MNCRGNVSGKSTPGDETSSVNGDSPKKFNSSICPTQLPANLSAFLNSDSLIAIQQHGHFNMPSLATSNLNINYIELAVVEVWLK